MTQVRRPLVGALALFTVAIALDRAGLGAGSDVVGTPAYVIAAIAILAPTMAGSLRRSSIGVAVLTSVATLVAVSAIMGGGVFGTVPIHIAAIELVFVGLSGLLGHALGNGLDHMDALLTNVALGDSPAIDLEGPLAANEIHTEVARSRRHDRPLSVTVLSPTQRGRDRAFEQATVDLDRALRTRFMFGSLARTVSGVLRRSDLLFEHRPTGRLIVLSPETDADGNSLLVDRILAAISTTGIETLAGTASFPGDGIGFETLVERAEREMSEPSHQPVLRAVEHGGI